MKAHVRPPKPPVLLLHSDRQLGPALRLHSLQPLQPGNPVVLPGLTEVHVCSQAVGWKIK